MFGYSKLDVMFGFLGGPSPFGVFAEPSLELAAAKAEFGATRRGRWVGQSA